MESNQKKYCGPIQAVILDWAGTAVDYGSFAPTAVFLRLFESRGVTITPQDARSGMGLMKKDHLRTILSRPAVAENWQKVHGAAAGEADVDQLFADFMPLQVSVLADYAEPISGLLAVLAGLRERKVRIGSTTGYTRAMMDVLAPAAARQGYTPDCIVCPDEVPNGRPYPWMCWQNAMQMNVHPAGAIVKVGDTVFDIEEGLNAGMWSVGVSLTGNLVGLRETEVQALSAAERRSACEQARRTLQSAGAHYVIDGIWDLPAVLESIETRLAAGEKP